VAEPNKFQTLGAEQVNSPRTIMVNYVLTSLNSKQLLVQMPRCAGNLTYILLLNANTFV